MGGGRGESKAEEGPRGGQGRRGQAGGDMLTPHPVLLMFVCLTCSHPSSLAQVLIA